MIACTRLAEEVLPAFVLLVKKGRFLFKQDSEAWSAVMLLCVTLDF